MRTFFINALELVIGLVVILMILGLLLATYGAATGNFAGAQIAGLTVDQAGPLAAGIVFGIGALYIVFVAGFLYLGLGIYQNTRRTAQLLEEMQAE